jgi:hypothetical protein
MLKRIAHEPLVHFVLLGALLFAIDAARTKRPPRESAASGTRTPTAPADPVRIVVPREIPPDERTRWIDEEVLYREGVARGLDRDDPRVRQRVASKMAGVFERELVDAEPTDEELRAWFVANSARYAKGEAVDFTQVFVADADGGDARAAEILAKVSAGADPAGLGDTFSGGRRYRRRVLADLTETFGREFVQGLAEQPLGRWERRRSRHGLHVVRVDVRTPAEAPSFEAVRDDVKLAVQRERREKLLADRVAELRKRWQIVDEEAAK